MIAMAKLYFQYTNAPQARRVVLWTKTRILWGAKCPKRPKIVKKPQNFKHFSIFLYFHEVQGVQTRAELRPWVYVSESTAE